METKEKITAATVAALRVEAGQSETRRRNAARAFERVPEKGTFLEPIVKEFTLEDETGETRVVKSIGYLTTDGSFVSESALTKSNILPEIIQIKSGTRKGRLMLRMSRLTDLRRFGKSQDEQLASLAGHSFTAKPVEIRVYKSQYLSNAEAFDEVTVVPTEAMKEKETVEQLLSCTEVATGYEFTIR